jgi:hypothetical protein
MCNCSSHSYQDVGFYSNRAYNAGHKPFFPITKRPALHNHWFYAQRGFPKGYLSLHWGIEGLHPLETPWKPPGNPQESPSLHRTNYSHIIPCSVFRFIKIETLSIGNNKSKQ